LFKESFNAVQNAYYDCISDGTCSPGNYAGFYDKLNTKHTCAFAVDPSDKSCSTINYWNTGSRQDGAILWNGAHIWGLSRSGTSAWDIVILDINGPDNPNAFEDDIIAFARCDLTNSPQPINPNSNACSVQLQDARHGKMGPALLMGGSHTFRKLFE
jgi:hypothetical protein